MKYILFAILFESVLCLGICEVADPHGTALNLYGSSYDDYFVGSLDEPENLVNSSYYDKNKNLTIFLPDYDIVQRCDSHAPQASYIENGGVNFILANYVPQATDEDELKDIDVDVLSQLFANFFKQLSRLIDFNGIHVVCFARGCELTAHFAQMINDNDGLMFTRVSLLDPPHSSVDLVRSIQKNSNFSDAIHTDGRRYGTLSSVAVADFFLNTGILQPTCVFRRAMKDSCDKLSVDICSQRNSFILWSESVASTDTPHFCSYKLGSLESVQMGLQCPSSAKGRYYLGTNLDSPFARGGDC